MGRIGMSGPGESDRRVDDAATSEGDMDRPAGGLIEEPYGRGEPGRLGLGDARLGDPAGGLIEELGGRVEMGRLGLGDARLGDPAGGLIEELGGRGETGHLGLGDARLGDPAGGLIEELAGRVEMGRIGSGDAATSGGDDSGSSIAIRRTLLDCLSSFNKTFSGARVFRLRSCGWRLKTT